MPALPEAPTKSAPPGRFFSSGKRRPCSRKAPASVRRSKSIQMNGAPAKSEILLGRRSRHGASAPRRKCGVRRREPLCGATGVYEMNGAPAKSQILLGRRSRHGASAPRRQCGVRRRKPLCGATGVYEMNGAPAKSEILWGKCTGIPPKMWIWWGQSTGFTICLRKRLACIMVLG